MVEVKGSNLIQVGLSQVGGKRRYITTTKTSAVVKTQVSGGLYQYKVAAVKKSGSKTVMSKYSVAKNCYFKSISGAKLVATNRSAKITWKSDSKASGYTVYYKIKGQSKYKAVTLKGKAHTSYTVKNVKKGKVVYVKVRPYKLSRGTKYYGILNSAKSVKAK